MKKIILFSFIIVTIGCEAPESTEQETKSMQDYTVPVFSDPASFDKLIESLPVVDKIYKDYADRNHFPSIVYGVVANGKLVFSGSHGQSNIAEEINATTKTVYRIASMSKSFTSMAILKLRDEGKLSLSDPITKYIPAFNKSGSLTRDASSITVQHLMTMSAGFPEDNPWGDRQLDDTDEGLMQLVEEGLSFSNVPGTTFEYSNLGYALLGRIISNVANQSYQDYITENILKPLGMNDSKWEYEDVPHEQLALGYLWENESWVEEPILHDGAYGAMGGMLCSLEDYAKYVALHLDAWPPRNDEETGPVKRSSIREMHQPWRFNNLFTDANDRNGNACPVAVGYGYGLGWRKDCTGKVRISHSGGLPGFGSEWRIYPDFGIGVISFSNERYGAPSGANALVLDTLVSMAGLQSRTIPASVILEKRKEQLIKMLPGVSDETFFAENFFMDQTLESRKMEIELIFAEAGAIVKVGSLRALNQLRGQFTIECATKNVNVFFTLTPEAEPKIQQLEVRVSEK